MEQPLLIADILELWYLVTFIFVFETGQQIFDFFQFHRDS